VTPLLDYIICCTYHQQHPGLPVVSSCQECMEASCLSSCSLIAEAESKGQLIGIFLVVCISERNKQSVHAYLHT
jgi:hypothetical protein